MSPCVMLKFDIGGLDLRHVHEFIAFATKNPEEVSQRAKARNELHTT